MTIGIGAYGRNAGAAVCAALAAAEAVGNGEIRGFAVLAAIAPDGALLHAETQDGGLGAIRRSWPAAEAERFAAAPVAALISSGPNRPEPLSQFLAAGPAGLVTGHRLPNLPGAAGIPLNRQALALLEAGVAPADAVGRVLDAHPEHDCGLIAVTANAAASGNTSRVLRRTDRGMAEAAGGDGASGIAVLHNAIRPARGLAELVADAGRAALDAGLPPLPSFLLLAGTTIEPGPGDLAEIDESGAILRLVSANPGLFAYRAWTSTAVYPGTPVLRSGRLLGHTVGEVRVRLADGAIAEVDPRSARIAFAPEAGARLD